MNKAFSSLFQVSFFTCCLLIANNPVTAQSISSDGTLPTSTEVTPTATGVEINGGTTRGGNLFHSFKDFSVPTGSEAFFNNASDVVNILNRVTGGNISSIDGLLRANGSANLFLINPAGIVFGEGARLDIGGSFYGSTADSILFPDGVEFSATDTQAEPILTINAPIGLGFRDNPGDIINNSTANDGNGLEVSPGNNITLLGGDVNFNSGNITAPGGIVNLGGLATEGTINFADDGSLTFPEGITRGDVSLTNASEVSVISSGGGSIFVNANNLELNTGSSFIAGIGEGLGSDEAQAGNIVINASDSVSLDDSDIFNQVEIDGIGNSGDIEINSDTLSLASESRISTSTLGQGSAGNVNINTSNSINVSESSDIYAIVFDSGIGNAGEINLTTSELNLTGSNSLISASTLGQGDAGKVNISASDSVSIDNEGYIYAIVTESGVGNGGEIALNTTNLSLTNGSQVSSSNFGVGNSGSISIDASESISIDGTSSDGEFSSGIFSIIGINGNGNAGKIEVNTNTLSLTNSGLINTSTFDEGNSGEIVLNTNEISLENGRIFNRVEENAKGNAGLIRIDTNNLLLSDGSRVDVGTRGQGNGGELIINAAGQINLDNSDIFNQVGSSGVGNAGQVDITTSNLTLNNGGQISASTFGTGDSGLISINASESVSIDGRTPDGEFNSGIFSTVGTNGNGNSNGIEITTSNLNIDIFGRINASTFGQGNAGEININASNSIFINSGDILSQIEEGAIGNSGAINITTENFSLENGGDIKTLILSFDNPEPVKAGNISIDTTNLNITGGSEIDAGIAENGIGNGGDIFINADAIFIVSTGFTGIVSNVIGDAQGNAGNVTINTRTLNTKGFVAEISASNRSRGNAGILNINATESISIADGGFFTDIFSSTATGKSGSLTVNTPEFNVSGTGEISVQNEGNGDGGILTINVEKLNLTNSSVLGSVAGEGNGANININASESITLDNGFISSTVGSQAIGDGGEIRIETDNLLVTNDSGISSSTSGQGNAGSILINANNIVINEPVQDEEGVSGISNLVGETATGNAGKIEIITNNLSIADGSFISSSVRGQGNGGSIFIDAQNSISIDGTTFDNDEFSMGIFSIVSNTGIGNGGEIEIQTGNLSIIDDDAIITASSFGKGNGGSIFIDADNINIDNGGIFAANRPSEAIAANETSIRGGDIRLKIAENLILRNSGTISARAFNNANGGNLTIDTDFIVAFPNQNNDIIANAQQGSGGKITINAQSVFGIEERPLNDLTNDINASSDVFGLEGNVSINTPDVDHFQETSEAPENIVEPDQVVAGVCDATQTAQDILAGRENTFVVNGRGGVPPTPIEPMPSETVLIEGESVPLYTETEEKALQEQYQPIMTSQGAIYPARGIVKNPDGTVILTRYPTDNTQRVLNNSSNCGV